MGKIIFYTRSGQTSPSSNYRILQYVPYIKGDKESRCLASEYLYKKHGNARTKTEKLFWYSLYYGNIQINTNNLTGGELIAIIYFTIKKSDIFKDIKKKFKKRKKKKDKIKEAVIIEED